MAPPSAPASTLPAAAGAASATCLGESSVTTDPTTADWVTTSLNHRRGKWYFEVTVEQATSGRPLVGLFAPPADAWTLVFLPAPFMREVSAAATAPRGPGVVSVAADLDAGVSYFYFDGRLTGQSNLLTIPGVGAFRAAARGEVGDRLKLNFGADPFAFGVPAGFAPWNGGVSAGACVSDPDLAAPPAPITVTCAGGAPCDGVTTFQSDANASSELIILGHYDAGSVSSWTWGTDANGNTRPMTIGPGMNGSTTVDLDRPGRPITLVLSAYEPTDWTLRVAPGTQLASVSLYGMHLQTITGVPAGVPVDTRTICTGGDGGNCPGVTGLRFAIAPHRWPFDTGGGDTQGFVGEVEARFCLPMKAFAGAYTARGYVVR